MECADSNASIDNISSKKRIRCRYRKSFKINQKYWRSLPIRVFSLYNVLSYRITFLCNAFFVKLIIHQKVLYDTFFMKKSCKVVYYVDTVGKMQRRYKNIFKISYTGRLIYAYSHYNMCAGCGYMYQIKQLANGNVVLVCPMSYYSYQ